MVDRIKKVLLLKTKQEVIMELAIKAVVITVMVRVFLDEAKALFENQNAVKAIEVARAIVFVIGVIIASEYIDLSIFH